MTVIIRRNVRTRHEHTYTKRRRRKKKTVNDSGGGGQGKRKCSAQKEARTDEKSTQTHTSHWVVCVGVCRVVSCVNCEKDETGP